MTITVTSSVEYRPKYRQVVSAGSTVVDQMTPSLAQLELTCTKTGVENPRWMSQVRNHTSATTGRTITDYRITGGFGSIVARWKRLFNGQLVNQWSEEHGQVLFASSLPTVPNSSTAADNEARRKFYKEAKDAQTGFRGLTFTGELRETLRMLRRPGQGLRRGLDDYLRRVKERTRRAKRSSFGRIVGETWLEHAFGWAPLLADIKAAGETLNRRRHRYEGSYTRVSGNGVSETATFDADLNARTDLVMRIYTRRLFRNRVSVLYYGEVRSVCPNPVLADMTLFGANFRELVPTAWELLPWSFLVDYFTNIGDILDAWSVRKSDISWCARSVKRLGERTLSECFVSKAYIESITPVHSWIEASVTTSPFRSVAQTLERSAATPALPSIQLEIPGFGTKWINLSALLLARNRTRRQMFQ